MTMTTRCPQCGTSFKVVPDQLRVRNGLVRCGECSTVFDGRACLVAQIPDGFDSPSVAPAVSPASASPVVTAEPSMPPTPAVLRGRPDIAKQDPYLNEGAAQDDEDEGADEVADHEPIEHYATDRADHDEVVFSIGERSQAQNAEKPSESGVYADTGPRIGTSFHDDEDVDLRIGSGSRDDENTEPHADSSSHDDEDTGPRLYAAFYDGSEADPRLHGDADSQEDLDDREQPVVLGESRTRYHGETDVGRAPPEFLDSDDQARRSFMRSLWGYACVLGLLLLAAQFLFVYRSTLAGMVPELRPLLVRLCEPVGCEVGYVRHIDRISITSSSLQPPSGQAGAPQQGDMSRLVLRASLRNLYDQPQPWPALRLDLSDLSDTVVIRKVLLPEDYLPKGQAQHPFEAGAELNIAVPIEVSGPHVTGFQLHKFFP